MGLFKWINDKVGKLSFVDVKLVGLASFVLGLVLAKLFPTILTISIWWFIAIAVLCTLKVYYVMFFKKEVA